MLWSKKEDKNKLPDLPIPKSHSFFGMSKEPAFKGAEIQRPMSEDRMSSKPIAQGPQFDSEGELDENDFNSEKHSLPSFPDSPIHRGFSQAAIKDAVDNESPINEDEFPMAHDTSSPGKLFKTIELEDRGSKRSMPKTSQIREISTDSDLFGAMQPSISGQADIEKPKPIKLGLPPSKSQKSAQQEFVPKQTFQKNADIFVRIDKFRAARRTLDEIKIKLEEVDDLLKKIRETKLREEQELSGWESDLNSVKARLNDVTENIFEKTE